MHWSLWGMHQGFYRCLNWINFTPISYSCFHKYAIVALDVSHTYLKSSDYHIMWRFLFLTNTKIFFSLHTSRFMIIIQFVRIISAEWIRCHLPQERVSRTVYKYYPNTNFSRNLPPLFQITNLKFQTQNS